MVARSAAVLAVRRCSSAASCQRLQAVDHPQVLQCGERGTHAADDLRVPAGLGEDGTCRRVAQQPPDLLGRRGLVYRHAHTPGRPDGVVDHRPLITGPRHQPDPVAGLDARGDDPPGQRGRLLAELHRRHILPALPGRLPAQDDLARLIPRPAEDHIRQTRGRVNLRQRGQAIRGQGHSLATASPALIHSTVLPGAARGQGRRSLPPRTLPAPTMPTASRAGPAANRPRTAVPYGQGETPAAGTGPAA